MWALQASHVDPHSQPSRWAGTTCWVWPGPSHTWPMPFVHFSSWRWEVLKLVILTHLFMIMKKISSSDTMWWFELLESNNFLGKNTPSLSLLVLGLLSVIMSWLRDRGWAYWGLWLGWMCCNSHEHRCETHWDCNNMAPVMERKADCPWGPWGPNPQCPSCIGSSLVAVQVCVCTGRSHLKGWHHNGSHI